MGDKQFIHAMLELFQNMQAKPNAKPTAATANPANAPAPEHGVLAELAFRVAMCEKRITALEGKQSTAEGIAKHRLAKRDPARSKKPNK